jgi:hypothetical protein
MQNRIKFTFCIGFTFSTNFSGKEWHFTGTVSQSQKAERALSRTPGAAWRVVPRQNQTTFSIK